MRSLLNGRAVCCLVLLFVVKHTAAQDFSSGYFISNDGTRHDCLIKNHLRKNNPHTFLYKVSENAATQTATIDSVKMFEIENLMRYERHTVQLDMSSSLEGRFSTESAPLFETKTLFLRVRVSGKAKLYSYEQPDMLRFFYSIDDSSVIPLVYKKYMPEEGNVHKAKSERLLLENNSYRYELKKNVSCDDKAARKTETLKYRDMEMVRFFVDYNTCNNNSSAISPNVESFKKNELKGKFNFRIKAGMISSNLKINSVTDAYRYSFASKQNGRAGLEVEYVLPFQKKLFAVFIEGSAYKFESEASGKNEGATVKYKTIDMPVGFRHYFPVFKGSSLMIDAAYIFNFPANSSKVTTDASFPLYKEMPVLTLPNFAFGAGITLSRFTAQVRYQLKRNVLRDYEYFKTNFNSVELTVAANIFSKRAY